MKKSNAQPKLEQGANESTPDLNLEFLDGCDFVSKPAHMDPDLFIRYCEEWLPKLMTRPGFWERRQADRCPAEFDLADPTRVPITYPAEFIDELLRGEPPSLH